MPAAKAAIIEEIVDQYFDEAAFLWSQREAAVTSSIYSLRDLAYLDGRVEAHIDGLRVAGEHGWGLCEDGLDPADPGTVFAATIIAFESGDKERMETVMAAGYASVAAFRAMVSGLGWMETQPFNSIIGGLVRHKSRKHRRLGIAACGVRRINPKTYLDQAVNSSDPFLKAVALKTTGVLTRTDLLPQAVEELQNEDHACRFAAAKSALLLGDRSALDTLAAFAQTESDYTMPALEVALRLVDGHKARSWLQALSKNPAQRRNMLVAVGYTGDPAYIPMLLKQMESPEYARVAGESFAVITGVDFVFDGLNAIRPYDQLAGPNDDPDDTDVAMDKDEDLPWPHAERVAQWWQQNGGAFTPGVRYLSGSPVSPEVCIEVLKNGNQKLRQAAALELALHSPETPFNNIKAPGFRQ